MTPRPPAAAIAEYRATLLERLREALREGGHSVAGAALEWLPDKGLAHDHVRLIGHDLIARLPKQSQMGLTAQANLAYQAACFERASASGHAPRLRGLIAPCAALPRGGLLVQEIDGRPARLPQDLEPIVDALAAIHSLPLPATSRRAPLQDSADPLAALRDEIERQCEHLDAAAIDPRARAQIDHLIRRWLGWVAQPERPPRRLVSFDAHPGNFLITRGGQAVLVDLEKARYSHPPLDLAHATLYTSTTWDVDAHAELGLGEVAALYARWLSRMGHAQLWQPWLVPLRAAMWLWAVSWCAKWRVLSGLPAAARPDGEDWSAARSDEALVRHVRGRVDCYLSAPIVEGVIDELAALEERFGAMAA
jgi:hypothetical protein